MNVTLIVYNRPELTRGVLKKVAEACPDRLFIVADGPKDRGDAERCRTVRRVLAETKLDCDVRYDFAERNLGCRERVSSGLDWVFSQVEESIILEDDCCPDATFFPFCRELLGRYRDDARVGHIGGNRHLPLPLATGYSYSFSRYSFIWGWATWRRAWEQYRDAIRLWPQIKDGGFHRDLFPSAAEACYFEDTWDDVQHGRLQAWGPQWLLCRLIHGTVSIVPAVNLVSNLGCGTNSTHTVDARDPFGNRPVSPMPFPLSHPPFTIRAEREDRELAKAVFLRERGPWQALRRRMTNKHFYGLQLRRIPILGPWWNRMRKK